jgi:hypothetical protein
MINRLFILISIGLLLAGCTADDGLSDILSGGDKTPLVLQTSLSTQHIVTRAANNTFDNSDELHVYVEHVKKKDDSETYESVKADQAPLLVSFSGETPLSLYWDDLSDSRSVDTYLRTHGHALRTLYGYCYNGGTPTEGLTDAEGKAAGIIKWTVADNQTSAEAVQHADLLWSGTQEPVTYNHTDLTKNTLKVPFTHAMSEVTVTIKADKGYTGDPLTSTVLTLKNMKTVATVNAPAGTITSETTTDITMCGADYTAGGTQRTYTAIVAPGTKLKVDEELLSIVNVDDNNYTLPVSREMLGNEAWTKGHTLKTDDGTYIETLPGVNYHIDVTVNKAAVAVEATLKDWTSVTATGDGDIAFDNDIVNFTVDNPGNEFADGSSFNLYWKESTATDYTFATESTLTSGKWSNATAIYWPNGTDSYYFRALTGNTKDFEVKQTEDVLWGTTAKHSTYNVGDAIAPRTGDVPLIFEHAMSKIAFDLTTSDGDDKVELDDAIISISYLYTDGTISIADGAILGNTSTEAAISDLKENIAVIVLPQTISNDAIVTITLKDGSTKYKIQLNTCTAGTTPITAWERGKSYTYTITVKKEAVQFRALIQDWTPTTGSGNATLDWD